MLSSEILVLVAGSSICVVGRAVLQPVETVIPPNDRHSRDKTDFKSSYTSALEETGGCWKGYIQRCNWHEHRDQVWWEATMLEVAARGSTSKILESLV